VCPIEALVWVGLVADVKIPALGRWSFGGGLLREL
jgi:hypothetical protein